MANDTARVWKVAAVRKGTPAWGAWPAEAVAADRLASVMAASVGMGIHARMHADKPMVAAAYAAAEAACRLAFMADAAQEEGDVA